MKIDLDALKAARAEAEGDAPTVVFGGRTFVLPAEMAFDVPESLAEVAAATAAGDSFGITSAVGRVLRGIFGEDYDAFMALRPSMQDIQDLVAGVVAAYGLGEDTGESSASE